MLPLPSSYCKNPPFIPIFNPLSPSDEKTKNVFAKVVSSENSKWQKPKVLLIWEGKTNLLSLKTYGMASKYSTVYNIILNGHQNIIIWWLKVNK